ncbi:LysR family transcriptional regulator [Novosphingobium sp.]|uniref:LysR family transcriptional regulator n=1 Tax=Novosphingobium sp. TaxID=1874826 RepID=UPI0031DB61A9
MYRDDLGSLAMFQAVAQAGSFTKAAAQLGVSQSALSHSLRRLEGKLGLRLLNRSSRSIAPTEAGERLLETLGPALEQIDARIASLTALRDQPAGTIRISAAEHSARTLLWPAVDRLVARYPDIRVEINVNAGLTDIVAGRYDAGIRLGERLEQDMIAVRIGPRLRMVTAGAPAYFAKHGRPATPHDLSRHRCINLRMPSGNLYSWEYEQDGRELKVKVDGQLVFNDVELLVAAAVQGHGLVHLVEDRAAPLLASGALEPVLEDWCEPFDGYYLYYPSRRQPSPAFSLLLEALRFKG